MDKEELGPQLLLALTTLLLVLAAVVHALVQAR